MRSTLTTLLLAGLCCALSANSVLAQTSAAAAKPAATPAATTATTPATTPSTPQVPSGPPSADEAALLQVFGMRAGLGSLTTDFVQRLRSDARTKPVFADSKMKPDYLASQLADQFCRLLNGPCTYDGETMKTAHAESPIARKDFLAAVELLQAAMDAQAIPFAAQNRLLALLAPMHRDIVNH